MKTLLFILTLILPLAALNSCSDVQGSISEIKQGIGFDKVFNFVMGNNSDKKVVVESTIVRGTFFLADGTYSTSTDYVVPRINIPFLKVYIEKLRNKGGGYVWLSYIDNASKDNECLFIKVTISLHTSPKPNFMGGGAISYQKNLRNFEALHSKELKDSILEVSDFIAREQKFLDAANSLLNQKVYVKSSRNTLSDVSGSVKSAIKVLTDARRNNLITDCALIGFSDFQNDPVCPALQPDPSVKVFNLISQPGKSKNCVSGSQEVMDVDYLFSILKL